MRVLGCLLMILFLGMGRMQGEIPPGEGVGILLFHGLVEKYDPSMIYAISDKEMGAHLKYLKEQGFKSLTISQLYRYFYNQQPLPDRSFMITFDDGRKDSYEKADPILKELGFTAVMFVITSMPDSGFPMYLNWEQLENMAASGRWEIQAHGHHFHDLIPIDAQGKKANFGMNRMWLEKENRLETLPEFEARLRKDYQIQKEILEKHFPNQPIIAFAFPFGNWGQYSANLDPLYTIAVNYQMANALFPLTFGFVAMDPAAYTLSTTPHLIVRMMDNGGNTPEEVAQALEGNSSLNTGK